MTNQQLDSLVSNTGEAYPVELIANGEQQTVASLTPAQIYQIVRQINMYHIENQGGKI